MFKFSNLTKEEKAERLRNRKKLLRDAKIIDAMQSHGYSFYDYPEIEQFSYLLRNPIADKLDCDCDCDW